MIGTMVSFVLKTANKKVGKQSGEAQRLAIRVLAEAILRIAPLLRAQGHVEARRQKVPPIRGHAAKDRLAVPRDAAARRQRLAAVGAGAAEVIVIISRPAAAPCRAATSPVPATDPEHSEPGGAGAGGRSAVGAHEGRAGRGPGREVQEVRGSNPAGVTM